MSRDLDMLREWRELDQTRTIAALERDFRLHAKECDHRTLDLRRRLRDLEKRLAEKKPKPRSPLADLYTSFSATRLLLILLILIATSLFPGALPSLEMIGKVLSSLK